MDDELREAIADQAHEAWSGWMRYLFEKSARCSDGDVTIPASLVARWTRQMTTPYRDLPERERESDRAEADRYLAIVRGRPSATAAQREAAGGGDA